MKYYVLIKRKGSKKWLGAIPSKAGVTLAQLRKSIKAGSKQFMYKIVSATALKRQIMNMKPRMKRKPTRRRKVSKSRKVRRVKKKPVRRRMKKKPVRRRMKKKPMRRRRRK